MTIAATEAFFAELFGLPTPGLIEVHVRIAVPDPKRPPRKFLTTFHSTPAKAAQAAIAADVLGSNVYFGCGKRTRRSAKGKSILALGFVWLDKDFHSTPPEKVDAEIATFLDRLRGYAIPPSVVIRSGRGVHCYWLLLDAVSPEQARSINKAIAVEFGEKPAEATDPARVLRIPGTHNRKPEYGAPILVESVGGFWRPGEAASRYRVDELPSVAIQSRPVDQLTAQPEVIARVLEVAPGASGGTGWRVSLLCPFHADTHPSAVVFAPTAYFYCAACGVSESVLRWTARPVVQAWGVAALVNRPRNKAESAALVPAGYFRAPRAGIKIAGPVLLAGDVRGYLKDGNQLALGRHLITDVDTAAKMIRAALGPLGFRVFWAAVAIAQTGNELYQSDGRVPLSIAAIGDLLGFARTTGGRHHTKTRRRIGVAIDGLARLVMRFRWSSTSARWFRGPVLVPLGDFSDGVPLYQLHLGIWYALRGNSHAWVPASRAALRLPDPQLATYLRAMWELHDHGGEPRALDLPAVAGRAGVWPAARYRHGRGRVLGEWQAAFAEVPELGVRVVPGPPPTLLVAGPHFPAARQEPRNDRQNDPDDRQNDPDDRPTAPLAPYTLLQF